MLLLLHTDNLHNFYYGDFSIERGDQIVRALPYRVGQAIARIFFEGGDLGGWCVRTLVYTPFYYKVTRYVEHSTVMDI